MEKHTPWLALIYESSKCLHSVSMPNVHGARTNKAAHLLWNSAIDELSQNRLSITNEQRARRVPVILRSQGSALHVLAHVVHEHRHLAGDGGLANSEGAMAAC